MAPSDGQPTADKVDKAPPVKRKPGKISERYEESLAQENKSRFRRYTIFTAIGLFVIAGIIIGYKYFRNYYDADRYENLVSARNSNPAVRKRLLEELIYRQNPYREKGLYLAVENGTDQEKEMAFDDLAKMNLPGFKQKCRKIWLDKRYLFSLRLKALGYFFDRSDSSDLELFFNTISWSQAYPLCYRFYLEKANTPELVAMILNKAKSTSDDDRLNAALSLWPIYDLQVVDNSAEVMDAILLLVNDNSATVRHHSASVLADMGKPESYPEFMKLLGDNDMMGKKYAVRGLKIIRDPRAIDALVEAVKETSYRINEEVADALVAIGWAGEADPGGDILESRKKIVSGMIAVASDGSNKLEARKSAVRVLGRFPCRSAVDTLINLVRFGSEMGVRIVAAVTLGRMKANRVVPVLAEVLAELPKNGRTKLRMAIGGALGDIGDRRAVPVLLDVVGGSGYPKLEVDQAAIALNEIVNEKKLRIKAGLPREELEKKIKAVREWYEEVQGLKSKVKGR